MDSVLTKEVFRVVDTLYNGKLRAWLAIQLAKTIRKWNVASFQTRTGMSAPLCLTEQVRE